MYRNARRDTEHSPNPIARLAHRGRRVVTRLVVLHVVSAPTTVVDFVPHAGTGVSGKHSTHPPL